MKNRGFTLVEVLVALFVMALLSAMAWRGVDGIARARTSGQARMEQTLRLDTVLTQWEQDLGALYDVGDPLTFSFDGASLRITRHTEGGVQLVVWSLRGGEWLRWASPPVTRMADLQDHWMRSQQMLGNEPRQLHALTGVAAWQLYCFRGSTWSNCQSTGDTTKAPAPAQAASAAARQALPTGVRLLLSFNGAPLQGTLTRDTVLAPQVPQ